MPFISCLIAVPRTSDTVWNKSGESVHPYLLSDLKENGFSIFPLSMMLAVGSSHMAFIMLRYIPSIPTLLSFYQTDAGFCQMLFLHLMI